MFDIPDLKTLQVRTGPTTHIEVAYKRYPNKVCVFSATNSAAVNSSSINRAEDIAKEIAFQEGIEVLELRFFDFQTRTSYSGPLGGAGGFHFDEVEFVFCSLRGILAKKWRPTKCPEYVVRDFCMFLDGEPQQNNLVPS